MSLALSYDTRVEELGLGKLLKRQYFLTMELLNIMKTEERLFSADEFNEIMLGSDEERKIDCLKGGKYREDYEKIILKLEEVHKELDEREAKYLKKEF